MRLFYFFCLISFSALAQDVSVKVLAAVKHQNFAYGVGTSVELDFKTSNEQKKAIFLGRMVDQDNETMEYLFLDEVKTRILMINPENLEGITVEKTQPVISPIDQVGSTCAAYGVFHYWNQIHASAFKATAELSDIMSSDRRRLQFMEETIDRYYIQNQTNLTSLMNRYGKRFGFKCKNNPFTSAKEASEFLFTTASAGSPIMIDFNIGSDMVSSTYEVTDYETPVSRDPRLWIPRKVGQRNSSGHVIVAAAAFVSKGKKKLLVLDSNWTEPRVWDLQKYIAAKTAVKEMGFHTCDY